MTVLGIPVFYYAKFLEIRAYVDCQELNKCLKEGFLILSLMLDCTKCCFYSYKLVMKQLNFGYKEDDVV